MSRIPTSPACRRKFSDSFGKRSIDLSMRSIPVKKSVNQLIFAAGVLVVWEGLALLKLWPPYVFPTPRGVAESFWAGIVDHLEPLPSRYARRRDSELAEPAKHLLGAAGPALVWFV